MTWVEPVPDDEREDWPGLTNVRAWRMMTDNGRLLATGGVAEMRGSRWVWLNVAETSPREGAAVLRAARTMLRRILGENDGEVFSLESPDHPRAAAIHRLLGFAPSDAFVGEA